MSPAASSPALRNHRGTDERLDGSKDDRILTSSRVSSFHDILFGSGEPDHPILDVTVFTNPRFTPLRSRVDASVFAMFGSLSSSVKYMCSS